MEKFRNIYDEFVVSYFHDFMDCITNGVKGGLYNETIDVYEKEEGNFKKEDIQCFIRFQHGDNDYHGEYSNSDDECLQEHVDEIAKCMLKYIDVEDCWDKKHYEKIFPYLIENTKNSLNKIIDGNKFMSFECARNFARTLNLKSQKDWRNYCNKEKKPQDIPTDPGTTYKKQGWVSYGDFLGTDRTATRKVEFLPFVHARTFVRSLNLKNTKEFREYIKSGARNKMRVWLI